MVKKVKALVLDQEWPTVILPMGMEHMAPCEFLVDVAFLSQKIKVIFTFRGNI